MTQHWERVKHTRRLGTLEEFRKAEDMREEGKGRGSDGEKGGAEGRKGGGQLEELQDGSAIRSVLSEG